MSTSATPTSGGNPPVTPTRGRPPLGIGGMHKGVERAVFHTWNCEYGEAEKILNQKREQNPRYAVEFAFLHAVKGLVSANNENRERLLDLFQIADNMASAAKSGKPLVSSSDDDEEEQEAKLEVALAAGAAADGITLSDADKKRVEEDKKRLDDIHRQRAVDRAEYKRRKAEAARQAGNAAALDQWWKLECDVIYADALMVRSILQLTMNSYLKGGYNLRKAWGCYWALLQELEKDTEKRIPKDIEMNIKCGAGMFYIYLALVPGSLMTLLSAIGFISDRDLGEQLLTEVLESNTVRSPVAAIVLLTFYLFLPTGLGDVHKTLAKVKPILDRMNTVFPNNCHFTAWANFYHRKLGHTEEALESINKAVVSAERTGTVPTLLRYLQGDTLYMSLQYEQARAKYQEVLDSITRTGEGFAYTGQLIISIAACQTMLGNKPAALALLKTVASRYNDKSKQDANSPKYAARVLAEPRLLPLIGVYVLYINRDLAHMQGKYAEKLQEDLTRVTTGEDLSPPEVRCMYWLFMGCMHKVANRREEAIRAWTQCRELEKKMASDSMTLPYVYYEMGEYEYRAGNLGAAKDLFDKGQSIKGDGHETLANRYHIAQKQLKREMKDKGLL